MLGLIIVFALIMPKTTAEVFGNFIRAVVKEIEKGNNE